MNNWNWTGFTLAQDGAAEVLGAPSTAGSPSGATTGQPAGPAGQAVPGAPGAAGGKSPGAFGLLLPLLFGLLIFTMITSMFSGKKEKKKRAEMLAAIKKRDKVLTAGGIIGTVAEVKGDEIVIKTEGTRMRFSRASVQQVLKSAHSPGDDTNPGEEIDEMGIENETYGEEMEPARS